MTDWKPETRATTTVSRSSDGTINSVKCRAEYYVVKENEGGEDEYAKGVNATFRFNVVGGDLAVLEGVRDIGDDALGPYDTTLEFIRAIPVAEDAVLSVPGIEDVQSVEEYVAKQFDNGRTAVR